MSVSSVEVQRVIEGRELPTGINSSKQRITRQLSKLREEAAVAQLYPKRFSVKDGVITIIDTEPSIVERAVINADWARRAMNVAGDFLLLNGDTVRFTQTVLSESLINYEPVGKEDEAQMAFTFGKSEIAPGNELEVFQKKWQEGGSIARRNIQTFANLTLLDVIGKVQSSVDRIR